MDTRKLGSSLKAIYDSMSGTEIEGAGDGWVNMAGFGLELSRGGINYRHYGYDKLRSLIESLPDMFEVYRDDSLQPPVFYIRLRQNATSPQTSTPARSSVPRLVDWAWLGHYQSAMQDLAEMALPEAWDFGSAATRNYSILTSYLTGTFSRLYDQHKIVRSDDGRWAAFNTGLMNTAYKPIYALFDKNRNEGQQEWHLYDFCVEDEDRAGKILTGEFDLRPEPAQYLDSVYDAVYDVRLGAPSIDHHHIIIERLERYPYRILKEFAPEGFDMVRPENLSDVQRATFFRRLKLALENDNNTYDSFKDKIDDAVAMALKRVQWDYKTAVPMYYPQTKGISLLLPLALKDRQSVDLALVVTKDADGLYCGQTIYPLEWAYRNARLICRPESDWLSTHTYNRAETAETHHTGRYQR